MGKWSQLVEAGRFLTGGACNTLVGFAAIACAQKVTHNLLTANIIGYIVGAATGYLIHSKYTFKHRKPERNIGGYLLSIGISYISNLGILFSLYWLTANALLAQALGMAGYIGINYWIQSRFVFHPKKSKYFGLEI